MIFQVQDFPLTWVLASFVSFIISRLCLAQLVPDAAIRQGPVSRWKWLNIANSLVHSTVTGTGAIYGFFLYPKMASDVVDSYNAFSHGLLAFSTGYFFYDLFDMLLNHRKRSSYELMVHHSFVIACFLLAVLSQRYIGYGMVSLLLEVNSAFLHWRQLMLICNVPKSRKLYRTVSLINLATFMVFRIAPLLWQVRWLAINGHTLPKAVYVLGCATGACIIVMAAVLFLRLLRADYKALISKDKH